MPDQMDIEGRRQDADENVDSEVAKFWKLYKSQADKHDTTLTGAWKEDVNSMLTFIGLFSAIVSAFLIETYKMLLPDNSGTTVALLTQLVAQSQSNSGTSGTSPVASPAGARVAFKPSGIAIRINILMFLSLFLSLTCALVSTLVQQWAREYLQYSQLSGSPQQRGRVRTYLFNGMTNFQMRKIVEAIPFLLHISVFLFFFAASEFLRTVDDTVGLTARSCVIVLLSAYLVVSLLPLILSSSPYQTSLTPPLRPCILLLRLLFRLVVGAIKATRGPDRPILPPTSQYNRYLHLVFDTNQQANDLDHLAFQWLLQNADEDTMCKFIAGLPVLIRSPFIEGSGVMRRLSDEMLQRVREHLRSSMSSHELSPATQITRAFASLKAIDAIISTPRSSWSIAVTPDRTCENLTRDLIKISAMFTSPDSALALRSACDRAKTFHTLIDSLLASAKVQSSQLPPHLLPLAEHLQALAIFDSRRWRNQADLKKGEMRVVSSRRDLRQAMLSDGNLINFLILIRDVLPYPEQPTLDLTPVWDTLGTIVGAFRITQPTTDACSRFEEVLTDVRNRTVSEKGGMRDGPNKVSSMPLYSAERYGKLLEFMDKVAKGLRLVTVLSPKPSPPQPGAVMLTGGESPPRHDHIYTMDPFSFFDVLEAFSSALQAFIKSAGLAKAQETVETMITLDSLLPCIRKHLDTSVNLGVQDGMQERMSIACLHALEVVFTLLEGSSTVCWYESGLGLDEVLDSANNIARSSELVSNPSAIHVYCSLGIINHVILDHLRSRIVQGPLPSLQDPEHSFIRKVHNWLHPSYEQGQDGHQEGPHTTNEVLLSQRLRDLLVNGPLQNFSIMANHMMPHLKNKETIPEIAWETFRKLVNVPGLAYADDGVTLDDFSELRSEMYKVVLEEGKRSQEQLRLLELMNTVAEGLGFPELPALQ